MTIGCPDNYSAMIVRQAGTSTDMGSTPTVLGTIEEIIDVEYGRILSGIAPGRVRFTRCPSNCFFSDVDPWAHELWIYRDGLLAFAGPIVLTRNSRNDETFEISAWDMTGWTTKRNINAFYSLTDNPTRIAENLLGTYFSGSLGRPDPEFASCSYVIGLAETPAVTVTVDQFQYQVSDKWNDLVTFGFNYTTLGRYTLLMGDLAPNIDSPYMIESTHISGDMELVKDGTDFATRLGGIGEGVFSLRWTGMDPDAGVTVPYYGIVDSPTVRYPGVTSAVQLQNLVDASLYQKFDLEPRLVIPAGSSLSSGTEIFSGGVLVVPQPQVAFPEMICGLRYDIEVSENEFCVPGRYPMRLNEVKVTWSPDTGEKVAVSFGELGRPIPVLEEA